MPPRKRATAPTRRAGRTPVPPPNRPFRERSESTRSNQRSQGRRRDGSRGYDAGISDAIMKRSPVRAEQDRQEPAAERQHGSQAGHSSNERGAKGDAGGRVLSRVHHANP